MFYKKSIRALIIKERNNHMPPYAFKPWIPCKQPGGGGGGSTLDKKVFNMSSLLISIRIRAIYTIRLKYGLIISFQTIFCQFG